MSRIDNITDLTNLQQRAEAGDAKAQFELANYHAETADFMSDNNCGLDLLNKAANQGYCEAQLTLGFYYLYDTERELLRKRYWDQMGEQTPLKLAVCLAMSKIFEVKDDLLAVEWLTKASEQKNPDAQFWLGYCFYKGIGIQKDLNKAFSLFNQAANQNIADAMVFLSLCYLYGQGVEQNDEFAIDWLNKSLEFDCDIGFLVLGKLYDSGRAIAKDSTLAFRLYQKAADLDNAEAQYILSLKYAIGDVVERDYEKRFYWKERAANNGHKEAKKVMIAHYLQKAASYGSAGAHWILGELYKNGDGVESNLNIAADYIGRSLKLEAFIVENGNNDQLNIGQLQEFIDSYKMKVHSLNKSQESLELAISKKEDLEIKMQKLVEQFTHTLGNVIFPDTIYQVAERLKTNPECRKDVLLLNEAYHSEIIIKLQAELLRQRYANTNPENFRQMIRKCRCKPNAGDKTKLIADILDYAASRVAARFLNQHNASLESIRTKILAQKNVNLESLRQKFEDDILLNKTQSSLEWISQNLRPFKVIEASPLWQKVCILADSHAEALLFGYFSEVLFNAFKYADHTADEFLTVLFDEAVIDGITYLTCNWRNSLGDNEPNSLGTGKGLEAIQEDLMQLNDTGNETNSLMVAQGNHQFNLTMFFKKDLLIDEVAMPSFKRKIKMG
jgi:TPR repeat protein